MSHRGRLNVLCNFMDKPFRAIISEFLGNPANPEDAGGSGDVKYHMGVSADREFDGQNVHLTLNRSEEHTSELQSLMRISYAVFCLNKKKQNDYTKKETT